MLSPKFSVQKVKQANNRIFASLFDLGGCQFMHVNCANIPKSMWDDHLEGFYKALILFLLLWSSFVFVLYLIIFSPISPSHQFNYPYEA
jgi:hypothetical protein